MVKNLFVHSKISHNVLITEILAVVLRDQRVFEVEETVCRISSPISEPMRLSAITI
jgi:hypothetical protein